MEIALIIVSGLLAILIAILSGFIAEYFDMKKTAIRKGYAGYDENNVWQEDIRVRLK